MVDASSVQRRPRVAGVVMAGGAGSRLDGLHRPKHLLPLPGPDGDRTLIQRVLEPIGDLDPLVVVTGHYRELLEAHLAGLPHRGLQTLPVGATHSREQAIDAALAALADTADAAVLVEGDTVVDRRSLDSFVAVVAEGCVSARVPLRLLVCERDGRPDRSTIDVDGRGRATAVRRSAMGQQRLSVIASAVHIGSFAARVEVFVGRAAATVDPETNWGLWQLVTKALLEERVRVEINVSDRCAVNVNTAIEAEAAAHLVMSCDAFRVQP